MEWTLVNNNLVEDENGRNFAIELNWLPFVIEKKELQKKVKLSKLISDNKVEWGATISNATSGVVQIAEGMQEVKGKVSLAALLAGIGKVNCIYFNKVSDGSYWVVCVNQNGSIEMTSDRVMTFYALRDYISERLALNTKEEYPTIYNMGVKVNFDDFEIDDLVEPFNTSELIPKEKACAHALVKPLSGNFNKKLFIGTQAVLLAAAGGIYYYLTTDSEEIQAIAEGQYSAPFTGKFGKISQEFKKVKNQSRKKVMTDELFYKDAVEQFNNYVLSNNMSNIDAIETIINIKNVSPVRIGGWKFESLYFNNGVFYARYEKIGEYPASVNYKDLDKLVIEHYDKVSEYNISPVRIEELGQKRIYEIGVYRKDNPALIEFITKKQELEAKKAEVISKAEKMISDLQVKSNQISELENSLEMLSLWDKKNVELVQNIADNISNLAMSSQPLLKSAAQEVDKYKKIGDVEIPAHKDKLMGEGGLQDTLYPLLQNYPQLKWGSYTVAGGYPKGVTDGKYKDRTVLNTYRMLLTLSGDQDELLTLGEIFGKSFVRIVSIQNLVDGFKDNLSLVIEVNEVNQDYLSLNK